MKVEFSIRGLQQAQAANARLIAEMQPSGRPAKFVRDLTAVLHRFLVSITHVDTGAYRAAQRMEVDIGSSPRGILYPDPGATNPRSGRNVASYAIVEEHRGGTHAAYQRTYEYGLKTAPRMINQHFRGVIR